LQCAPKMQDELNIACLAQLENIFMEQYFRVKPNSCISRENMGLLGQKSENCAEAAKCAVRFRRCSSVSAFANPFMPLPAGSRRHLVDLPPPVPHPSTFSL
jgi:hypothetical protein